MTTEELTVLLKTNCVLAQQFGVPTEEAIGSCAGLIIEAFQVSADNPGDGNERAAQYFDSLAESLRQPVAQ